MKISTNYSNPVFQAKPANMKAYNRTIKEGLDVINKKMGLIIHNSSVPSKREFNTGIGSLLSTTAAAAFLPFVVGHGFTTVQEDPSSLRGGDPSPYSPLTSGHNIYMIPLEKLASHEYGNILSKRTLEMMAVRANKMAPDRVDYNNVRIEYDHALWEAFTNFKAKAEQPNKNKVMTNLAYDFERYKEEKLEEYEPQAIYELLSKQYNNDNWKNWHKVDQKLYDEGFAPSAERLQRLRNAHGDEIEFYVFKQFLADRELAKAAGKNEKIGIKTIGDSPIAFTPIDEWLHKDLFMEGLALGCPPDYFSEGGQRWGFSVLKPETIFNEDGTLGEGGKLMMKRYEDMFANSSGGARIDHTIGLIDPFVYSVNEKNMTKENSGRLYSSPNHPILGKYAKKTTEEYEAIISKILIPAAEKYGLTKDDIIFEDLGELTEPVVKAMKNLGLSGIDVTEFDYRGKYTPENEVLMLGCHDNVSYIEYTDELFSREDKGHLEYKAGYIAEDTAAEGQDVEAYKQELLGDKKKFMSASFAELFTSPAKRIQIFFTDFFGIGKTYNKPGTTKDCWTLRLPWNYERLYYRNVAKGIAINIPEMIATAIRHKGGEFAEQNKELLERLDKFTEELKR